MNFEQELLNEAKSHEIDRYVVGAIIFLNSMVLLLERGENDFMGGIYELPSGKVESGESLMMALHREVEEETSIKIYSDVNYLGYFDYFSKSGKSTRQFNFSATPKTPFNVKLQEHSRYVWAKISELDRYTITNDVKEIIKLGYKKT